MEWNNFIEFLNQPVPIIGVSIGLALLYTLLIISKTSIGKKALNSLKKLYEDLKQKYTKMESEKDAIIAEKDAIIEKITKEFDDKVKMLEAEKDEERKLIIKIAENINNVKIRKIIEEVKNGKVSNQVKEEI